MDEETYLEILYDFVDNETSGSIVTSHYMKKGKVYLTFRPRNDNIHNSGVVSAGITPQQAKFSICYCDNLGNRIFCVDNDHLIDVFGIKMDVLHEDIDSCDLKIPLTNLKTIKEAGLYVFYRIKQINS
ncbi:MAG: hypothetical protein ABIJ18_01330 [archaeon]